MARTATKSKLKRPESTVTESGRRVYAGSLAATHTELTVTQEKEVLQQMKTPIMASQITVTGRSPFDPFTGESVRRLISNLADDGEVELIKGKGWRLTPAGLKSHGLKEASE